MSNLVNIVKSLLGSMFDVRSFEAKKGVRVGPPIDKQVPVRSMLEQ